MALQGPIPVEFGVAFPSGAYAAGAFEPVRNFEASRQYVKIRRVCGVPGAVNVASGAVSASGGGTLISIPYWAAYSCRSPIVRRDVAGGSAAGGSGMACSARSRRVRAVTWLTVVGGMPKRGGMALTGRRG